MASVGTRAAAVGLLTLLACSSDFELQDTRLKGIASVKDNVYGDGFHHVIDVFTKMGCIKVVEVATMSDPAISADTEHLAGDGANE